MGNIALTLQFATGRELVFNEYSTIDMNRNGANTHINVTNNNLNFAFSEVFDQIQELLGDDKYFSINAKREGGEKTFPNMTVDYHLTGQGEILHFGTFVDYQQEQQENNEESTE